MPEYDPVAFHRELFRCVPEGSRVWPLISTVRLEIGRRIPYPGRISRTHQMDQGIARDRAARLAHAQRMDGILEAERGNPLMRLRPAAQLLDDRKGRHDDSMNKAFRLRKNKSCVAPIGDVLNNMFAMTTLGIRIRERLSALRLSQAEAARRAGLSAKRFGNYVNDEREPDQQTLIRICRVLSCTPDYLYGFRDQALPSQPIAIDETRSIETVSAQLAEVSEKLGHMVELLTVALERLPSPGDRPSVQ